VEGKETAGLGDEIKVSALDQAEDEIVEDGQAALAAALADLTGIFMEGDVADIMQAVFNAPVLRDEVEQALRGSLLGGETGDAKDDLVA
jgi:hypothetical protein